ncbi:Aste57867_24482 [Aphanomyces stellatus]|uniref:Aste57867_24482 protein n=1 Tax=Aphanomyces stellatus TaxID=120398 RepID=A0A485LR87_9STRA|nr:hypothetical protein As57867_024405 [Aphanomyces stellatus]VFU01121.1 Aste57867_24482 [Aphanomyces stellatus]
MLVEVIFGTAVAGIACAALALRIFFGPGEEEHKERMDVPHLADEVALEKTFKREIEYIYRDGKRFYTQVWHPKDQSSPKGVVVHLHGMDGHSGRATAHFNALLTHGWVAAAYDQHGFGRSSGRHGYVTSIADLADDALAFLRHLKARFPDRPLFLAGGYVSTLFASSLVDAFFGRSMGGLTAVYAAIKAQSLTEPLVSGLILQAPALHIHADRRPPYVVEQIGRFLHALGPKLPLLAKVDPPPSADGTPLGVLPSQDPLFYHGRLQIGTALAIVNGIEGIASRLQDVTLPLLIQHGDADNVVPVDSSRHLYSVAASTDKTIKTYPQGGHLLWLEPAWISQPFLNDMTAWLNARA